MAWSAVKTFIANTILTASDMNTYVSDNTDYLKTEVDSHHVLAGTSTTYAKTGGILYAENPEVANVSTTPTNGWSQSLAANLLAVNTEVVRITFWVTYASNGNNKRVHATFGGTTVCDTGTITPNGGLFTATIDIMRTGAATQISRAWGMGTGLGNLSLFSVATPAETLSGAVTAAIVLTGTDTNDIVLKAVLAEYFRSGN